MKVGIFTLPLKSNYGGVLQVWALQTYLERQSHQVIVPMPIPALRPRCSKFLLPLAYTKRIIRKLRGSKTPIRWEQYEYNILGKSFRSFEQKNIHLLHYKNIKELNENDYDILIVGSDQIWRPRYNKSYRLKLEDAYFEFAKDWQVKRVSYAPSFGVDIWEYSNEQTKTCGKLLNKFDAVSVRESSGVELCKKYFDVDATHLLDPTMLLDSEDYNKLIDNCDTHKPKGNMLCYLLDSASLSNEKIKTISSILGYTSFNANSEFANKKADIKERGLPPIEQWLRDFRDSKFVLTDSFHACVFSILYEKQFLVCVNEKRGLARIISLLNIFNLENRIVTTSTSKEELTAKLEEKIDFENKVRPILNRWRIKSKSFLEKNIKK